MTDDIISSQIPQGSEVRWYAGGTYTTEEHTVTAGEKAAGGFALGATADYGSVWAAIKSGNVLTPVAVEELAEAGVWATESTVTAFVTYSGIAEDDVVQLSYVSIATALTHVATAQDVSFSNSADTDSVSVQGQANKIQSTGAVENTATLNQLAYTLDFIALVYGDLVDTENETTPMKKFSNKTSAFQDIGCIVGKRRNSSNSITRKWFLMNAKGSGANHNFPTAAKYNDSFNFIVGHYMDVILE